MTDVLTYPKQIIKNFQESKLKLSDISVGEGGVVSINGKNYAAYKESDTEFIILSSICTHARCQIIWNNSEKVWDCPCHGSRYSVEGLVLRGPAKNPLKRISFASRDSTPQSELQP